jgi:predicted  nucleic acid-binding Zn-ribbon protein
MAKLSFSETTSILYQQIEGIEKDLVDSQTKLVKASDDIRELTAEVEELKKQKSKLKADRSKMSEYMGKLELDLANSKVCKGVFH